MEKIEPLHEVIGKIINNYYELRKLDKLIVVTLYIRLDRNLLKKPLRHEYRKNVMDSVRKMIGENVKLNNAVQKDVGKVEKIKPPSWGYLIKRVKNQLDREKICELDIIEECQISMAYRLYQIGMGKIRPGFHEINALTFLLEKSVSETENILELLDEDEETYNLDSAEGINALASKVVTLFLAGYISLKTAERTLDILQKKITFSETAHLLPTFEDYRKTIHQKAIPILVGKKM